MEKEEKEAEGSPRGKSKAWAGFLSLTEEKRGLFYRLYQKTKTNPQLAVLILFAVSAVNMLQEYI